MEKILNVFGLGQNEAPSSNGVNINSKEIMKGPYILQSKFRVQILNKSSDIKGGIACDNKIIHMDQDIDGG